jgi:RNA polymerase sigma-54 factor
VRPVQQIIDGEDRAHPLSDEQVVKIFEGRGLEIARRTIAKYRTELGILSSSMRRRG